ncbi:MAG: TrkH family potassium uptake protein [Bacillota bacterium]|nr:TrkH family potassium uptake protein [Bacillota bacterium]
MNRHMVAFVCGRILLLLVALLLPSLIVALVYGEGWTGVWPFLVTMLIAAAPGLALSLRRPTNTRIYSREGFVIVALSWFGFSVIGALPFLLSGVITCPIDAFFEAASGFTTTGASILLDVEALPHSLLFWRSFTHLIGGMGVLVFALAVLPSIESDDVSIMQAEVPGPVFGKLRARLSHTARLLYLIYLAMTAVLVVFLCLGGMPLFDALVHSFGTAGTGGFGIKNNSVAFYNSSYIDYCLAIGMFLFGVNFNLYYMLLYRRGREILRNEELRWYLGIALAAIIAISLDLIPHYSSFSHLIRDVVFSVSSVMTTTGFSIVDFAAWPLFSRIVLLLLMFVGAMAGSTAGGLKVSRVAIYAKTFIQELRLQVSPNRRLPVRFEGRPLGSHLLTRTGRYLFLYIGVFTILLLITSFNAPNFLSAFSAVAATFNNIGPGFDVVGPTGNFAGFNRPTTLVLAIGMIMGRLEIIPVLVLLAPRSWRRG